MASPVKMTRVAPARVLDAPMFNRYVKAVQRSRVHADAQFHLHRQLAEQMFERRKFVKREAPIILEVGAHTGYFLRHMLQRKEYFGCKQYIQCDVSEDRLNENYNDIKHLLPENLELVQIVADEEQTKPFEVPDRSVDMAVSCLSLHWVNNLEAAMVNIRNALRGDGFLMLALFGGNTLFELKSAFALADLETSGGMAAHCSPLVDGAAVSGLTLQAGFSLPSIDLDRFVLTYKSPFDVMEHLAEMGEQAAFNTNAAKLSCNRSSLISAAAIYEKMYRKNGVIPATFEVFHGVCWSPSPDQPQPLERGSGKVSLSSVGSATHKEFSQALSEAARNPNDKGLQEKTESLYKQLREDMQDKVDQGVMNNPEVEEILLAENQRSPNRVEKKPVPPGEQFREKDVRNAKHPVAAPDFSTGEKKSTLSSPPEAGDRESPEWARIEEFLQNANNMVTEKAGNNNPGEKPK